MVDKANGLIRMIESYTNQIEQYESLSTWFAAFSLVCILSVMMFAALLIVKREKEKDREYYNIILSGIFLIIPSIVTLYLYVFAMNMRKVALYRGYLCFLEEQWNSLAGSDIMMFDVEIMRHFFSFHSFWVNGIGPIIMAVFVGFSLMGFWISAYFIRKLGVSRIKKILKLVLCVLAFISILFDGMCVYYLSINDSVMESVIDDCEQKELSGIG